jgi:hypothetical protein
MQGIRVTIEIMGRINRRKERDNEELNYKVGGKERLENFGR